MCIRSRIKPAGQQNKGSLGGVSAAVIEPPWRILFVAALRTLNVIELADWQLTGTQCARSGSPATLALDIVTIMSHLRVQPETETIRTMRLPLTAFGRSDLIRFGPIESPAGMNLGGQVQLVSLEPTRKLRRVAYLASVRPAASIVLALAHTEASCKRDREAKN